MEVRGLKSIPSNKIVYCTMEVDGCDKLQTDQAEASKPWYARSPNNININIYYFWQPKAGLSPHAHANT